ncbi:MAG: Gfo/Idh/MocA family oxidoreductase [Flavobacterium sp.]|nr:Gfo/Idh/MocA family oxidoreductase [Pedobacter sp.]
MQKPIVTGLMAYGMSGKIFHAPFLKTHPGFKFHAVLERTQQSAQKDYPEITSVKSADDLFNDQEIELLIINTPNYTHYELAKKALLSNKHVLIEKPATTTSAEIKELFDLGRSRNKKVMVYQNRRYASDYLATKNILDSGSLGEIIEMHLRFDRYRNFIGPKEFKETSLPGSGILYDLGSHLLDQSLCLFGNPAHFHKTLGKFRKGSEVDDYAHLHLQYTNKMNVFITMSMLAADPQPGIVIHGTKGSFIKSFCDTQEEQLQAGMLPDDEDFGKEPSGNEGLLTVMDEGGLKSQKLIASREGRYIDFFEAVYQTTRNEKEFPVKEEEIIWQLELLEKTPEFD